LINLVCSSSIGGTTGDLKTPAGFMVVEVVVVVLATSISSVNSKFTLRSYKASSLLLNLMRGEKELLLRQRTF
jgi:hypothetical protein